jgi:hypothetical protein
MISKVRYAVGEILEHGSDGDWWRQRFYERVNKPYSQRIGKKDEFIYQEDWDNLIILDACRYDLFKETLESNHLPGELSERRSNASATPEFLSTNFSEGTFHDTVYVTSNPYVNTNLEKGTFHDIIPVWKEGWNENHQVVTPETMLEYTLKAADKYPNKRLIAHFTQPHAPFIGDKKIGERKASNIRREALGKEKVEEHKRTPFEMLEDGEVSKDEVWEAYLSNLERALPSVEKLMGELNGLTVISSDHGNALGEFSKPFPIRIYGHPIGIHIPALTRVPWHVYKEGERRDIEKEEPKEAQVEKSDEVDERLRMLGYKE